MKVAGIAIDAWKLPIFERRLAAAGYAFTNAGTLIGDTLLLKVNVADDGWQRLAQVVLAANTEAARTGKSS